MELCCYEVVPGRVELRPAPRRRAWMDETPDAYHCLPLVIANLHGWEMLCPFSFEVVWRGGAARRDLEITIDPADAASHPEFVASHFGNGILSFNPSVIVRTAPGFNLWVTGPVNAFKDGIQPMSACIETDWLPFTFSNSWKVTRPGLPIRFAKGEPFCAFFPIKRGVVAACEPRLAPLDEDPALVESYHWANARRQLDSMFAESKRETYQRWYIEGEYPRRSAGKAPADHEVTIAARPFKR